MPVTILQQQPQRIRYSFFSSTSTNSRSQSNHIAARLVIAEEVQDRLQCGQPVVAFESTVIAQGLPFPENLKLHEHMVAIARKKGVTPATIGALL